MHPYHHILVFFPRQLVLFRCQWHIPDPQNTLHPHLSLTVPIHHHKIVINRHKHPSPFVQLAK